MITFMSRLFVRRGSLCAALLVSLLVHPLARQQADTPLTPLVDHKEVVRRLTDVVSGTPDLFTLEKIGESVEGRAINYVKTGNGPFGVVLWSQMHGDEATATS